MGGGRDVVPNTKTTTGIDLGVEGLGEPILIGQGGFGAVYRAEQPALGRTVAVKILSAPGMDERTRERFERECMAIGALSGHPNIVTVFDSGINSWGRPFIVMDFMSRGSVADRVALDGPLQWPEAVDMGVKVCGAVASAHAAGILHRDIKPQNVLVSAYGEPKLGDFGISSIGGEQTSSGTVTASLEHAAPELLDGAPASVATDVYALASTVYMMVGGQAPFARAPDEPIQSLISRILTERAPDLRPRGVPGALCDVLERGLDKDPATRYASATDFANALREVQEQQGLVPTTIVQTEAVGGFELLDRFAPGGTGTTGPTRARVRNEYVPPTPPPSPTPVWRRPLFVAAAVFALLAIAATSFALTRGDEQAPARAEANDVAVAEPERTSSREEKSQKRSKGDDKKAKDRRTKRNGKQAGTGTSGIASYGSGTTGGTVPSSGSASGSSAPSSGTGGSTQGGSKGGGSGDGGGAKEEPPPPAPPAPDMKLYHAYKGRDHVMYTDPGMNTTYYNQGYKIETLGGVYSRQEEGTKAIAVAGRTVWVFATPNGQTSPQTGRRDIWFMSGGTDDDFYTADEGLTTYYYSRGWAKAQHAGWVAS